MDAQSTGGCFWGGTNSSVLSSKGPDEYQAVAFLPLGILFLVLKGTHRRPLQEDCGETLFLLGRDKSFKNTWEIPEF